MYRTCGENQKAKIDALERALAEAYEEQRRAAVGDDLSLAVLRLRAGALQRDIEALRRRRAEAPRPMSARKHALVTAAIAVLAGAAGALGVSALHAPFTEAAS